MGNLSGVAGQLNKELVRAQQEVQRFTAALAALGSSVSNGRHTLSASARKRISLAQKARWAQAKGQAPAVKPTRATSAAGKKEDRGCRTCSLGEVQNGEEEGCLEPQEPAASVRQAFRSSASPPRNDT